MAPPQWLCTPVRRTPSAGPIRRAATSGTCASSGSPAGLDLPSSFSLHGLTRIAIDGSLLHGLSSRPGQRIVETIGTIPGHLVNLLSDSQSCAHPYLHVHANGQSAVLESGDLYCCLIENSDWMENPCLQAGANPPDRSGNPLLRIELLRVSLSLLDRKRNLVCRR